MIPDQLKVIKMKKQYTTYTHRLAFAEARSHADINKSVSPVDTLRKYHNQASMLSDDTTNLFISLTSVDKLGINPRSMYDTPLGIYAYSVDYVFNRVTSSLTKLPFVGNAPYVNIFEASNPSKILVLNTMTQDDLNLYIHKLRSLSEYSKLVPKDTSKAIVKTPGGIFWYITLTIASRVAKLTSKAAPVVWNVLFRKLGIDGCVDTGDGIIHKNEVAQAVFFTKSATSMIERIINKDVVTHKFDSTLKSQVYPLFKNVKSKREYDMIKLKHLKLSKNPIEITYIPLDVMIKYNLVDAFEYARFKKIRLPEIEPTIALDPVLSVKYAQLVIGGKWEPGEDIIATSADDSFDYAFNVLSGTRFIKGEPAIATNPQLAASYAVNIVKGKWDIGEAAIATDADASLTYATDAIGRRFIKGERAIASDWLIADEYNQKFGTNL